MTRAPCAVATEQLRGSVSRARNKALLNDSRTGDWGREPCGGAGIRIAPRARAQEAPQCRGGDAGLPFRRPAIPKGR